VVVEAGNGEEATVLVAVFDEVDEALELHLTNVTRAVVLLDEVLVPRIVDALTSGRPDP